MFSLAIRPENTRFVYAYAIGYLIQILNLYSCKWRVVQIEMYLYLYTRQNLYVYICIFNNVTNHIHVYTYTIRNVFTINNEEVGVIIGAGIADAIPYIYRGKLQLCNQCVYQYVYRTIYPPINLY